MPRFSLGSPGMNIHVAGDLVIQAVDPTDLDAINTKLAIISKRLGIVTKQEAGQMATMEELQAKIDEAIAEVSQNTDAVASASSVMSTLAQQLADAVASSPDPAAQIAAVQTVIDGLNANNDALGQAIAAATPAAPAEPPA